MDNFKFLFLIFIFSNSLLCTTANCVVSFNNRGNVEALSQAGCDPNGTLIADGVCIEKDYNYRAPPDQTKMPISDQGIRISFWNYNVLQINEKRETILIDAGLTYFWRDDRIKTDPTLLNTFSWNFPVAPGITLKWYDNIPWDQMIWHPQGVYFHDAYKRQLVYKPASFLQIMSGDPRLEAKTKFNENATFLVYKKDYHLGINCNFEFSNFPMDRHICHLKLTNRYIRELKLTLYDFTFWRLASNEIRYLERDGFNISASFEGNNATRNSSVDSYVLLKLDMHRIMHPYFNQYYAPSVAIVCISQISFIIPPSSIPGRLGLVATLFLTMTNILIDSNVSKYECTSTELHRY